MRNEPEPTPTPQREYWRFYWPLTIMGLALLLANQFQNGILSRYPDAARELTTFALAGSFYGFLHAALIFLPQMTNVYGHSRDAIRSCMRFTVWSGVMLSMPLVVLGWTSVGDWLPKVIFGVDDATASTMQTYFRILGPVIFLDAVRHSLTGLLVQARSTGWVTLLNLVFLTIVLLLLFGGFHWGFAAVWTVGLAQLGGSAVALLATYWVWRRHYRTPAEPIPTPSEQELWRFFWPVAITSICFALSRPVIFLFASRTPEAIALIAALRVTFDFSMLFLNPINQFRHLMVTFGLQDLTGVRRFMILVVLILSGSIVVVALTPLNQLVFAGIFGLDGLVLEYAGAALLPLALVPLAMGLRNWFHGHALVAKTTRRMGAAAIARISIITLASWILLHTNMLGPRSAAFLLAFGFLAEATTMWAIATWYQRQTNHCGKRDLSRDS